MEHIVKSFFIGGPLDGQTKVMRAAECWIVLELNSRQWSWRQRKYVKVHESIDGTTAVFEFEPYQPKFFFTVEVDAVEGSSEKQIEKILDDLLKHIDGHHEAFLSGVEAARVTKD
jgi:hypothetical protein